MAPTYNKTIEYDRFLSFGRVIFQEVRVYPLIDVGAVNGDHIYSSKRIFDPQSFSEGSRG
jgi:hypothetical protein